MDRSEPNQTLHEVLAALQGDAEGLDSLLGRYHARLAAIVIATGAYRTVDDVVQEALIKILLAIRERKVVVTTVEQFRAWAHSVARNTALDYLRKEGRQMRHIDSVLTGGQDGRAAERVLGGELSPSMHAQMHEKMSELRRLDEAREDRVAELKRLDQILVWMRERDGMTFAQIAAEIGAIAKVSLNEDAMRIRYSRIIRDKIGPAVTELPDGQQ